jgi:NAD(P)H-dependent FMN reductase
MRNVVCISGTSRPGNYTSRALAVVVDELGSLGEATRVFDARELTLGFPGQPETADARTLQQAVADASAVLVASPEYHGGICAHTKLIIENLGFPSKLAGKPVALLGVAAGRIGAIKSLEQLKGIMGHVGAVVVPGAVSIAGVQQVFDEQGRCTDEASGRALQKLAGSLHTFLNDFVCPRHVLEQMVREGGEPWTSSL